MSHLQNTKYNNSLLTYHFAKYINSQNKKNPLYSLIAALYEKVIEGSNLGFVETGPMGDQTIECLKSK
jgi:hypothetical protein